MTDKDNSDITVPLDVPEEVSMEDMSLIETENDPAHRPMLLTEFAGQEKACRQLDIAISAAKIRKEVPDHILFNGPPGLGKTTLAKIVANEMGANFINFHAPAISKAGDLVSAMVTMPHGEPNVIFIDEIHRLNKTAAEMLYTAMEDFRIDIIAGEGAQAHSVTLEMPAFTLVGATTRPGMLPGPFLDRFGLEVSLEYYDLESLTSILARSAEKMNIEADMDVLGMIARRGRGTPRIAKNLLKRVRDWIHYNHRSHVTEEDIELTFDPMGIETDGLDRRDMKYMNAIGKVFKGGPVGIETLASNLSEDVGLLESSVEPYLMKEGFLMRTPRGRELTDEGLKRIGIDSSVAKKKSASTSRIRRKSSKIINSSSQSAFNV